jgi:hypothetical protein
VRVDGVHGALGRASLDGAAVEQQVHADLLERLKAAVEGECEGLAITDAQGRAILAYLGGLLPVVQPVAPLVPSTTQSTGGPLYMQADGTVTTAATEKPK